MNYKLNFIPYLLSFFLLLSCSVSVSETSESDNHSVKYATGYKINKTESFTHIRIYDPWDTTQLLQSLILIDKTKEIPSSLPKGTIIRTPIEKAVVFNSPQCNMLSFLNSEKIIAGVCEPEYITLPYVRKGLKKGEIINLGMASSPDIEKIIELSPEVIFVPAFQNNSYQGLAKTGIPIIQCAEYMEQVPLGSSEWIRLHSLFLDKETLADSLFNVIEESYATIKNIALTSTSKPRLLTDMRYNNIWYTPACKSFMATLYKDAGAELALNNNNSTGSMALSVEEVLDKAQDADIWLIKYYNSEYLSYSDIKDDFIIYTKFDPWINRKIFACNTYYSSYYETLPLYPHLILKDLVRVFHPDIVHNNPEIFKPEDISYFKPLKDK